MARLRQIGNYAIDYLYNHRCSLDDLIRHLQGLARYEESADDENGDLVEKGSDFFRFHVSEIEGIFHTVKTDFCDLFHCAFEVFCKSITEVVKLYTVLHD